MKHITEKSIEYAKNNPHKSIVVVPLDEQHRQELLELQGSGDLPVNVAIGTSNDRLDWDINKFDSVYFVDKSIIKNQIVVFWKELTDNLGELVRKSRKSSPGVSKLAEEAQILATRIQTLSRSLAPKSEE